MIGDALDSAIGAAVIDAEDRGARHQRDVVEASKLGEDGAQPVPCRLAVNGEPLREEAPAEHEILLGEDDAGACAARGQRRHEARGA